jgi:hypothetical protein
MEELFLHDHVPQKILQLLREQRKRKATKAQQLAGKSLNELMHDL